MQTIKSPNFEDYAGAPFHFLGPSVHENFVEITVFSPHTDTICLDGTSLTLLRQGESDYFYIKCKSDEITEHYTLNLYYNNKDSQQIVDPYSFREIIPEYDLHIFAKGNHWHIYDYLGANEKTIDGITGILFAVWAPNAKRMSVVGDFNLWDGTRHPMQNFNGVWALFVPGLAHGSLYKFEMIDYNQQLMLKTDPYGKYFEFRPNNSAIIQTPSKFHWQDKEWQNRSTDDSNQAISIYEVHLGSWKRDAHSHYLNYRDLAHQIVDYVLDLGFTHIELLPITEHPFDGSWGYQTLGYFAPTSRFGTTDDFRYFVNHCHINGIGVLLDWVPAHFPTDDHGLARFDGTALYEHVDPRKGEHRDWGTYIFNYDRAEVKNLLISSALFWLEEYHLDGLRVDAVASMLYLDYSREENDWIPNEYGGNENLEAIEFIKHLTSVTHSQHPNALLIAEESTAWPGVTTDTKHNGLGFNLKWNMGWMHDSLAYFEYDPIHRSHHHDKLTFGLLYSFSEKFALPFSHDECVHGKGSIVQKMSGDDWQKFANVRALYTYMFTYPGKKLLFMGNEFGQTTEWNHDESLPWHLLEYDRHQGIYRLIKDLNHLYRQYPALHASDFSPQGFQWMDCDDTTHSVISYTRNHNGKMLLVILNLTPVPRENYLINSPVNSSFKEIFNSDSRYYGGGDIGNHGIIPAGHSDNQHLPYSISLNLPPLGALVLAPIDG